MKGDRGFATRLARLDARVFPPRPRVPEAIARASASEFESRTSEVAPSGAAGIQDGRRGRLAELDQRAITWFDRTSTRRLTTLLVVTFLTIGIAVGFAVGDPSLIVLGMACEAVFYVWALTRIRRRGTVGVVRSRRMRDDAAGGSQPRRHTRV